MKKSMTSCQEIGFFQFDNLLRNRIPFALLSLGVDFSGFYEEVVYQNHLFSQTIPTTKQNVLDDLASRNVSLDHAIIVICPKGDISSRVTPTLEKQGYSNVFIIRDGYEGLLKDRP